MTDEAADTALAPMVIVALEQRVPRDVRIVDDSLAGRILPIGARIMSGVLRFLPLRLVVAQINKMMPGMWSGFLCRKRYIDDKLVAAIGQMSSVVNLGAGFDTRLYRLADVSGVSAWEVDQRRNIEAKQSTLRKALPSGSSHVVLVPIDFDREDLTDVLASNGHSLDSKTFYIWEAVSQYVTESGVRATFEFLSKASSGSHLVFTYVQKDFIDGDRLYGHQYLYERMVVKEKSWIYGMNPDAVEGFLSEYGWQVVEHLGYEELAAMYVKPERGELSTTEIERIVYAEKL